MLSPLDDYPVHQISEPMRHVGTSDRNFYDRYYFNIHGTGDVHGTDEELFCVIGVGQYPNLGVADAFVSVKLGDDHRVVRSSKVLGADRMDASVGPDPGRGPQGARAGPGDPRAERVGHRARRRLRRVQRGTPRGPALRPPVLPGHLRLHPVRPGGRLDRHPQGRATARSRSPPTSGGDPATGRGASGRWASRSTRASACTDTSFGFFWVYAPVRFDDHAMVTIVQERSSGERIMQDAHRVSRCGSGHETEWLGRPEHELRFAPGTRTVTGATLSYFGPHGQQDRRGRGRDAPRLPAAPRERLRPRARLEARHVPGRPGRPGPAGRRRPTRTTPTGA